MILLLFQFDTIFTCLWNAQNSQHELHFYLPIEIVVYVVLVLLLVARFLNNRLMRCSLLFDHRVAVAPVSHHYCLEPQQIENEITVNLLRE